MSETNEATLKKPRKTSDKQITANQANAKSSTGPNTVEGKAISSRNATTHGMRSSQVVLATEDPIRFAQLRHDFHDTFRPGDAIETKLVDDFVVASWRLDRCILADTAVLDKQVLEAGELFELDADDHFHEVLRNLPSNPRHGARQLRGCVKGTQWAIASLDVAIQTLEIRTFWYVSERDHVLNIFGLCTEDVFFDAMAYDIVRAFTAAGWSTGGDLLRVQALLRSPAPAGMPVWEYRHRVDSLAKSIQGDDAGESRAKLVAILKPELERLKRRLVFLQAQEARSLDRAVERAAIDTSADGQTRARYEMLHRRAYRHTFNDLMNYRKCRDEEEIRRNDRDCRPPRTYAEIAPSEAISGSAASRECGGIPKKTGPSAEPGGGIPDTLSATMYAKGDFGGDIGPDPSPIHVMNPTPEGLRRFVKEVEASMHDWDFEKGEHIA